MESLSSIMKKFKSCVRTFWTMIKVKVSTQCRLSQQARLGHIDVNYWRHFYVWKWSQLTNKHVILTLHLSSFWHQYDQVLPAGMVAPNIQKICRGANFAERPMLSKLSPSVRFKPIDIVPYIRCDNLCKKQGKKHEKIWRYSQTSSSKWIFMRELL